MNRQFVKLHFNDSHRADKSLITHNIYTCQPLLFMMDPNVRVAQVNFLSLIIILTMQGMTIEFSYALTGT